MKKLSMILGCLLLVATGAFAQKGLDAAKADFAKRVPVARELKWEVEKNGYEAEYQDEGREVSVVYDLEGNWVETERGIGLHSLSKDQTAAVEKKFPGAEIKEVETVVTAKGQRFFELEIKHQGKYYEVKVDPNGEILGSSQDGDEGDDDGDDDQD